MQTFNNVQRNGWSCSPKHGPAPLHCWRNFSSGEYQAFQKQFNLWLGCAPPNTAQFFHGVEEPFRQDVRQRLEHNRVYSWAALPNIPCHGPARFAALKNRFGFFFGRLWTTFKWTAGRAPLNTVELISRCWKSFSTRWCETFLNTIELIAGPCSPKHGPVLSRCWGIFLSGC